jgi:hypothetical protein
VHYIAEVITRKASLGQQIYKYGEAGIMTNAADDFDALFEEVSAQSKTSAPAPAPAPAAAEDDLESLFEEVAAARPADVVAAPAAAPAAEEAALLRAARTKKSRCLNAWAALCACCTIRCANSVTTRR